MRDAFSSISLSHYYSSSLEAIAEFIEGAEEGRGGICRYSSCSFVSICRSKTSVSVHSVFPFSYKEWVSNPGLVVSIDLTSLSGIGKGSSVNESLDFIPLLLPQSGPLLWFSAFVEPTILSFFFCVA